MTEIIGDIVNPKELVVDGIEEANATATVTISNVAPAAVGTATISKWLKVTSLGTTYYIPMWT